MQGGIATKLLTFVLCALLFFSGDVLARGHSYRSPGSHRSAHARSAAARRAFVKSHPCPSTGQTSGACPGYVVDHIQALKHGGADDPSNMQWQTKAAARAKDKWE